MNFQRCLMLIILCACVASAETSHAPDKLLQTEILSKQQMKKIDSHLAHLFDLPLKRFNKLDRQKRMAKSQSIFLLEMYQKKHGIFKQEPENYHWTQHKSTIQNGNYIVTFEAKKHPDRVGSGLVLSFNLSRGPQINELIHAELRLFRKPSVGYENQKYNISVYTFSKEGIRVLHQDIWGIQHYGWMVLNATNLFLDRTAASVKVHISGKFGHWNPWTVKDLGVSDLNSKISERPFLVAYFNTNLKLKMLKKIGSSKKCRNIRSTDAYPELFLPRIVPSVCTLKIFYVDFDMLDNFTSVIVPNRYQANYCIGRCSFPLQSKSTNHAIIQALYSSVKSHFEPLCAPDTLSAIDVIHLDHDENVVHKTYEQMVVKKCSCQ